MSQLQVTGEAKIRDIQGPVVANSGVITALDGAASQYVRGDGTLADFPTSTGGGSSVSYYLNSSVSQGTIGGVAYRELSKEPIIGAGTDITISANGYVASYITDANDPDVLSVPGGNFNCEFYFSVNNNTGNPTTYAELYKYDGTTFTLLGSSQAVPESLNQGTTIAPYYFAIPVATAALALTDRLAIRIYVSVDGRVVTLHTENSHLCQVVTTFSKGMVSLNNLTDQSQFITTGTSGTNFNIVSSGDTHTFNLPVASATNTGKLSNTDWSTFNAKQPAGNYVTLDTTQTITAAKTISGLLTVNNKIYLQTDLSTTGVYLQSYNSNEFSIGVTSGATTYYSDFNLQGANRNYTFPNIDGTIALLEGTQTFSGAKTFSLDILVNGLTIGRGAGSISTNTVVGSSALSANTTGYGNTSIGLNNLFANTTGFFNVAIGASSLISNTTGTYNAALGTSSLYNNTTGSNNTAVGQQAGESNTTGSNNTYIGRGSGFNITTGSNNTIIGAYTGTAALANNIVLADGAGNVRYQWNGTNNVFGNPISGTSASFSSNVNVGTNIAQLLPITTTNFQILTGCYYDGSNIIATATSGTRIISNAGSFTFNNFTGATIGGSVTDTTRLTIASTGAATFKVNTDRNLAIKYDTNITISAQGDAGGPENLRMYADTFRIYTATTAGGLTERFTISNTGAATFSSSVQTFRLKLVEASTATNFTLYSGVENTGSIGFYNETSGLYNLVIRNTGNVGIGTSSPSSLLTVAGGTSLAWVSAVSRLSIDRSGSVARFQNYDGGSAANISLAWDGGNVGINTSSPAVTLHALGKIRSQDSRGGSFAAVEIYGGDSSFNPYISVDQNNPLTFITGAAERMRITSSGNVGIGTSSPFNPGGSGQTSFEMSGSSYSTIFLSANSATVRGQFSADNPNSWVEVGARTNHPLLLLTNNTERMRITSGGQVQIKQPADGFTEGLRWINTLGNRWTFVTGGDNNFYIGFNEVARGIFNSSTGVYTAQSDKNKKKDFEESTIGLNAVLGLKPTLYRMKEDDELVEKHLGFIAQEVKDYIPQAYTENINGENTFIGLTEMPIIAALVKAVQEQQAQIEELKALINK